MDGLKDRYKTEVAPALVEKLELGNVMRVPRVTKVVVNMGFGVADKDVIKRLTEDLAAITGQRPVTTKARKSISNFKLREGMTIGAKVTLRGNRMYDFLERLIDAALPRIRDFRGISRTAFDGHGNYTLGLRDQSVFPELDPDDISQEQGMDVTIVTSTEDDDQARELLTLLGMPFSQN